MQACGSPPGLYTHMRILHTANVAAGHHVDCTARQGMLDNSNAQSWRFSRATGMCSTHKTQGHDQAESQLSRQHHATGSRNTCKPDVHSCNVHCANLKPCMTGSGYKAGIYMHSSTQAGTTAHKTVDNPNLKPVYMYMYDHTHVAHAQDQPCHSILCIRSGAS
jgi:hypothetical protein